MMNGPYEEIYRLGFAIGFLLKEHGVVDVSDVALQIVAEEITPIAGSR
jgi:hypothetical protein